MATTQQELAQELEAIYDGVSDIDVDPAAARATIAQQTAQAIANFVIGRTITVDTFEATDATGSPIAGTATGTIDDN